MIGCADCSDECMLTQGGKLSISMHAAMVAQIDGLYHARSKKIEYTVISV